MQIVRGIVVGLAGAALVIAVAAFGPTLANEVLPTAGNQTQLAVSEKLAIATSGDVVWARVPYCNCLATSATANVANALKEANLTVSIKEQSPHDGWLYFVTTYDAQIATPDQVSAAIVTGGGEIVDGPP